VIVSGIYCFEHKATGRCYVGQSKNIERRRKGHFEMARNGSATHFHKALRLYGAEAFTFSILEECSQELDRREKHWIERTAAYWLGFNMTPGGETSPLLVPEVAAKVSAKMKGRKKSPEHIAKVSAARRGVPQTAEAIAARSAGLTGRKLSPEHARKISEAKKGKPSKLKGRVLPPEQIEKLKARRLTEAHKQQISEANAGRQFSAETRAKMSASHKMRHSLETTGL
jgi:group I intron endonuclease